MHYKKLNPAKIRSRLVRKGFFTQLPVAHKPLEGEVKLFRTILDHSLFEATSPKVEERKDVFKWFNPQVTYTIHEVTNVMDFNAVCSLAGLKPHKTRVMMLNFLDKFFPQVFTETSCSFRL